MNENLRKLLEMMKSISPEKRKKVHLDFLDKEECKLFNELQGMKLDIKPLKKKFDKMMVDYNMRKEHFLLTIRIKRKIETDFEIDPKTGEIFTLENNNEKPLES